MPMQVFRNASPCSLAHVEANIKSFRLIYCIENFHCMSDHLHHLCARRFVKLRKFLLVLERQNQQMSCCIWIAVENHKGPFPPVNQIHFILIRLLQRKAKWALIGMSFVLQILHSPGRPELFHNQGFQ